jgi:GT2 family glycosyltransferase
VSSSSSNGRPHWPSLSIVHVAYNRREELRTCLHKMLVESDYQGDVEVIVVDNASTDGTADMIREEWPQVRLIARDENIGAPAWNDGFAIAKNDWVLILDDDCYLPPDGLTRALAAAEDEGADLVSFKVVSTVDPNLVFTENYRTGLFMFWGCAALLRTPVIQELGYDPELFMWANELELTMRFYDRGYKHLHMPEVVAQHMKAPGDGPEWVIDPRGYTINANHWGYIAAKLMHPRDAVEALVALFATCVRDGFALDRPAFAGIPETLRGFAHGLRLRKPLRSRELSRFYRRNFITFASPWWLSRPVTQVLRALPREVVGGKRNRPQGIGRRQQYFEDRARYYPRTASTLQFKDGRPLGGVAAGIAATAALPDASPAAAPGATAS